MHTNQDTIILPASLPFRCMQLTSFEDLGMTISLLSFKDINHLVDAIEHGLIV